MDNKNIDLSTLRLDRTSKENKISSNKIGKIILWIASLALFFLILIYFFKNIVFTSVVDVYAATAIRISASQSNAILTASGYVVAQRKASIASKGTGRLVFLGVVEGDEVKKNQVIARLEDNDIKAQLEQAKANLKLNQADLIEVTNEFNRQKALLKSGSTSQANLDMAEARYLKVLAAIDVAKALVLASEVSLENTLIRVPFDGTVLTKNADVGEIVAPLAAGSSSRSAVVTIADMTSLEVEADVSESNIQRIKLNQDCEISLDAYSDVRYPGFVAKIVPTADRSKATVLVKIGFKNYDKKVLPEMRAKVSFLNEKLDESKLKEKPLLVVPNTAVFEKDGNYFVFKIVDDTAVEVNVTVGKKLESFTEITSGIIEGEKVISKLNEKIKNNIKVKVL